MELFWSSGSVRSGGSLRAAASKSGVPGMGENSASFGTPPLSQTKFIVSFYVLNTPHITIRSW